MFSLLKSITRILVVCVSSLHTWNTWFLLSLQRSRLWDVPWGPQKDTFIFYIIIQWTRQWEISTWINKCLSVNSGEMKYRYVTSNDIPERWSYLFTHLDRTTSTKAWRTSPKPSQELSASHTILPAALTSMPLSDAFNPIYIYQFKHFLGIEPWPRRCARVMLNLSCRKKG